MDNTRHLPAGRRRMTTWKIAVLFGTAALTAATWAACAPPGWSRCHL